jgi:hypothetical protein
MDKKQSPQLDVEATIRGYEARSISASMPRLAVAGALAIAGFVVVVLGNRAGWIPGGIITLFALIAYLALIEVIASRNNDALEAQRWRRFRAGGSLGLALGAALGFAVLNGSGQSPTALSVILAFLVLLPATAGFAVGYLNLRLHAQGDKRKLAAKLRTAASAKPVHSARGRGSSAARTPSATDPVAKIPAGRVPNEVRPGDETVGFYWFDSRLISDMAAGSYGRFVYERMLPHLAPSRQSGSKPWCVLYDGDCMTSVDNLRWYFREQDRGILDGAAGIDENLCYVVAVLGAGIATPQALDSTLRLKHVPGYLGLSMPGAANQGRDALERCRMTMALSVAARIDGATFSRISYDFHGDDELKAMGFKNITQKQ